MKPVHINCRCSIPETEMTCTDIKSDYSTITTEEPEIKTIRIDDFEAIKEYNKKMKDCCPNFHPWPETQEDLDKMLHEKAIESAGGIENLNWAKVLVGEMTPEEAEKDIEEYYKNKGD